LITPAIKTIYRTPVSRKTYTKQSKFTCLPN